MNVSPTETAESRRSRHALPLEPKPGAKKDARAPLQLPAVKVKAVEETHHLPVARIISKRRAIIPAPKPRTGKGMRRYTSVINPKPDKPQRPVHAGRRQGAMSKGELYEYYKRNGMLEIYFQMFPNG